MVERLPFFRNKNLFKPPVFSLAPSPWKESGTEWKLLPSFFSRWPEADPFCPMKDPTVVGGSAVVFVGSLVKVRFQ